MKSKFKTAMEIMLQTINEKENKKKIVRNL